MEKKRAFTLIELILVIAMIGILVSFAVMRYGYVTQEARDAVIEANSRDIVSGIHIDYLSYGKRPTQTQINDIIKNLNINKDEISYKCKINDNEIIIVEYNSTSVQYAGITGYKTEPVTLFDIGNNLNDGSLLKKVYFAYPIGKLD